MKKIGFLLIGLLSCFSPFAQYSVSSPDQKIVSEVKAGELLYYSVKYDGKYVLLPSSIVMAVNDSKLGKNPKVIKSQNRSVNKNISTVWWTRKNIEDNYNELILDFEGNYSVIFRAYNEGVAYRFVTRMKGKIKVMDEESDFRFDGWPKGWFSESHGSYETSYIEKKIWDLEKGENYFLPCIVKTAAGVKAAIVESDLNDYPCMLIQKRTGFNNDLKLSFDKYPLKTKTGGFDNYVPVPIERADYIALTDGTRSFPWRVCIIAKEDAALADCDLVYKLARPLELTSTDWIKPGLVVWDWWADYIIEGADFVTGVNTKTYLYQIDFAKKWNIPYIIIDWHWSDGQDLLNINPEMDMPRIMSYAKEKGVGVILWCPAFTLDRQLDKALDMIAGWNAAGVKVDFFDRWDQLATQLYERIAKACAQRKLIVDFHGCYLPTGLHRAYPNILNYEAVMGNEVNKWGTTATPEHKATLPFTRMLAGPMDFTPGGMRNAVPENFAKRNSLPFTQGTRCNEMALFVVYFEALKMLADAATEYLKEPVVFEFLSKIPSVWDETKVLNAVVSDHVTIARKKGNDWYVGGINDLDPREITIHFEFLEKGKTYKARIYKDGLNTDKVGTEYIYVEQDVTSASLLKITMNKAGGFIMKLEMK